MSRLIFVSLLLLPLAGHAEIYKWTDAEGRVHFGDKPTDQKVRAQEVEVKDYLPGSDAETRAINERRQRLMDAGAEVKRRSEPPAAREAASREESCREAAEYLRTVSGPVVFTDELGKRVKVTEQERIVEQRNTERWIDANCR